MKTQIAQFCSEFAQLLVPLGSALQSTIDGLSHVRGQQALRGIPPGLADVRHRLQTLIDKVKGQEAYVLVFGPLKSGKSTLLNAISGAYVSEVTTLPAYPCMVYVRDAERNTFSLFRYNGEKQTVTDPAKMQALIDEEHRVLAARIRAVEDQGRDFDPATDYPEAIRRIDVELPAKNLVESSTVLVDTPGLYSRMKFGYDLMTREVRNSAACAVFVVKTDNLFLEQVFQDFNDLLGMFTRIFVVVNLDTTKRDLGPDGSLTPSLESEAPAKIIDAFESLTMSAPLRKAAEAGRLRIHPMDLLSAASRRLRDAASEQPDATADPDGQRAPDRFDVFLQDLTQYLNSTDYLTEFMGDSLRQGVILCGEIGAQCDCDAIRQGIRRREALEAEAVDADATIETIAQLEAIDWRGAFDKARDQHAEAIRVSARDLHQELDASLRRAVDDWFTSDGSLADLRDHHLNPILKKCAAEISAQTESRLRFLVGTPMAGADLPAATAQSLERIGIALRDIYESSVAAMTAEADGTYALTIDSQRVPVRKGFFDYVLFRNASATRRKVLGPPDDPSAPVPRNVKERRLGEDARNVLLGVTQTHLSTIFPSAFERCAERLMAQYVSSFRGSIAEKLTSAGQRVADERQATEKELVASRNIMSLVEQLTQVVRGVVDSIGSLEEKHNCGRPGEDGSETETENPAAPQETDAPDD